MSLQEKLIKVIGDEILPDLVNSIDELFEIVAAKQESDEDKEEIKILQTLKQDFEEILEDVKSGEMEEEEYEELFNDIEEMTKSD